MKAFSFTAFSYLILPVITLYSCFENIYLLDVGDPEFLNYLILWTPGIFLYYIYAGQLIIGQRLPFLDRIWGFPNLIRKHRGLASRSFLLVLVIHSIVHFRKEGIGKLILKADSGMIAVYISVLASIILMIIAAKVWLKPRLNRFQKVANYRTMHRLHQVFYLLAIGVWYHVVTANAFSGNILGTSLVTGYLLFAFSCKLYMLISGLQAPIYRLESIEVLHENFVRLRLRATQVNRKVQALHQHKAGQYAYFSFALKDQKGKVYWEQHPFSFAGFAPQDSTEDASLLTIVVKNLGNFTAMLPELPFGNDGTKVKVLGPYGKFSCEDATYSDGVILLAAGVGITPFLSMLEQKAFAAEQEPQRSPKPLSLHWFVRNEDELVFADRFRYFCERLPHLVVKTYVGQSLSENLLSQALSSMVTRRKLAVLYCGPGGASPTLLKVMNKLGIPRRNFHTELFAM